MKRDYQISVCGMVKEYMLEGGTACPDLFSSSVCNTNTVHYLSMEFEEFKWKVKEKEVINMVTEKT